MSKMRLMKGKPEERAISAESKLFWAQYYGPMAQAAAALNAAITNTQNIVATAIVEKEGLAPGEWLFDMDRLVLVRRPRE